MAEICKVPIFERKKQRKRKHIKSLDVQLSHNRNKRQQNASRLIRNDQIDIDDKNNDSENDIEQIECSPERPKRIKHVRFNLTAPINGNKSKPTKQKFTHCVIADEYEYKKPSFMLQDRLNNDGNNDNMNNNRNNKKSRSSLKLVQPKRKSKKNRKRKHDQIEQNTNNNPDDQQLRKKRKMSNTNNDTSPVLSTTRSKQKSQATRVIKSILKNKKPNSNTSSLELMDCSLSPIPNQNASIKPTPIRKQLTFTPRSIEIDKFDEDTKEPQIPRLTSNDNTDSLMNTTIHTNVSSVYLSVGNIMNKILPQNDNNTTQQTNETQKLLSTPPASLSISASPSQSTQNEKQFKFKYYKKKKKNEQKNDEDEYVICVESKPPSIKQLKSNIRNYGELPIEHQAMYYSNEDDVDDGSRKNIHLVGLGTPPEPPSIPKYLESFQHDALITNIIDNETDIDYQNLYKHIENDKDEYILEFGEAPPSFEKVQKWIGKNKKSISKSPSTNIVNEQEKTEEILHSPKYDETPHRVFSTNTQKSKKSKARRKYKTPSQHKRKRPSYVFTQTQQDTQSDENKEDSQDPEEKKNDGGLSCAAGYILKCNDQNVMEKLIDATTIFCDIDDHLNEENQSLSPSQTSESLTDFSSCSSRDSVSHTNPNLTIMSIEILCSNRKELVPDPKVDAVLSIGISIAKDDDIIHQLIMLFSDENQHLRLTRNNGLGLKMLSQEMGENVEILSFDSEIKLFHGFIRCVRFYDPDIMIGWEIQKLSLGYIIDRAMYLNHIDIISDLGRIIISKEFNKFKNRKNEKKYIDEWGQRKASGIHIVGRILLNLWRCCRSEIKLNIYTKENVVYNLLNERIPLIPYKTITKWYNSYNTSNYYEYVIILKYLLQITSINFDIINDIDLIGRTSEMSRVIGIDFFSVLSRGSQYRVESLLIRIAKPQGFIMISPSKDQVANQNAMECIPLVMEPKSSIFTQPLLVLDFQSLYPSIMIAYNICYSTCLGKLKDPIVNKFGIKQDYNLNNINIKHLLSQNINPFKDIWISPNGIMFLKPHIRKGILNRMVEELLNTRIMTKNTMKEIDKIKENKLYKLLNARQYSLKLICNVTYGYTSAGFSGRMPCAEIADSIVEMARETLEQTIKIIENNKKWNAKVIYGDTDSVFVLLNGVSLKDSFKIGKEISSVITSVNPNPIKLKFEKVYYPSILLAKKRYVGLMYEKNEKEEPVIDAKGIEMIRRDSCPIVQETMQNVLNIIFKKRNVSEIKKYLINNVWSKILKNEISFNKYIFCKEVRLGTYKNKPPAAIVAERKLIYDSRSFPLYAQRIPYIVIYGKPNARLIDMVIDPLIMIRNKNKNNNHQINSLYYITRQINPAIGRILELLEIDVNIWFNNMAKPKIKRQNVDIDDIDNNINNNKNRRKKNIITLDSYYLSKHCLICDNLTKHKYFCISCRENTQNLCYLIIKNKYKFEKKLNNLKRICRKCICKNDKINVGINENCISLDCPITFEINKTHKQYRFWSNVNKIIQLNDS